MLYHHLKRTMLGILLPLGFCTASVVLLLSACSSGTSSTGTATAIPTGSGPATATSASAAEACAGLDPLFQMAQAGKHVGFDMNAQPNVVVKGSLTTATNSALSGTGFLVSPNDKVTLQLNRSGQATTIVITDTVSAQTTTYTVSACAATSSTILALTGSAPTSFTANLSVTSS